MEQKIIETVLGILRNSINSELKNTVLTDNLFLSQDLGLDSMDFVSFAFAVEKEFKCDIVSLLGDSIVDIHTVGDVKRVIGSALANASIA